MDKNFEVYEALGFPIIIENPRYIEFAGEKVLDVNPKKIMAAAFKAVIKKSARLSGSEVKFLRGYMQLSQEEFAKLIGVERSLISKWQDKKGKFTGMNIPTETTLRVRCLMFLNKEASISSKFYDDLISKLCAGEDVGEPIRLPRSAA